MTYIANIQEGFASIFEEFKQIVTISVVTRSMSVTSEEVESVVDTVTYALVEYAGEGYSEGKPGYMVIGDALAIFNYADSVGEGDYVTIDSKKYVAKGVTQVAPKGVGIYKEVQLELVS